MTLHGPADADVFRVKVGRYGDRWYHDPLPSCPLAEATSDAWPSASTIKKAWPKFLTAWAASETAKYAVEHREEWERLDRDAAVAVVAKAPDRTRDNAAGRGTLIHGALETLGAGLVPDRFVFRDVELWLPAIEALVAEVDPTWELSEAVVISRTLGIGGTLDAVWQIDGKRYLVDFKSRAEGKVGNAYDDEGIQLGLYAHADYAIVERDGQALRQPLGDLDGGLIVTLAPEGYRLHPVDIEEAKAGAEVLRRFWQVQTDPRIIGKPVQLRNNREAAALRLERRAWLIGCLQEVQAAGRLDEVRASWPLGVPTFREQRHHSDAQLDAVVAVVDQVAAKHGLAFFDPDPAKRSERRIIEADLMRLAGAKEALGDDDLFAALIGDAGRDGEDELTAADIDRLVVQVDGILAGRLTVRFADDGSLVWRASA